MFGALCNASLLETKLHGKLGLRVVLRAVWIRFVGPVVWSFLINVRRLVLFGLIVL